MAGDPERIPVIVGVGQINDRPGDPQAGLDSVELMIAALRLADADAGGSWLTDAGSLGIVDQISFPTLNPATHAVAKAMGACLRFVTQTDGPMGDSPLRLLSEAANRIGSGEIAIALVTGGEALRTAAYRAAAAANTDPYAHNALHRRRGEKPKGYRESYGLAAPVDIYPLYENACRAAWQQTLAQGQAESGAIWSNMSQVAARNDHAWLRAPRTAETVIEPSASNRPIAHPYTKLQVANSSVNQGAAFIVASLAEARRRGVADNRLVYVGLGAAAHEPEDVLARDRYDRSAGMEVSIRKALALNGLEPADLDHVELYSCFPCVPKMARRVLDWPSDRPMTVFGGLTFGGGPIGNYMSHAVGSMVDTLRHTGGKGLLFANGGYATHNHTLALSSTEWHGIAFPQDFDFQAEADKARMTVPKLDKHYEGAASIETYTVTYGRDGSPKHGIIVARTVSDARTLALVRAGDSDTIAFLTDGAKEPIGSMGQVRTGIDGLTEWTRA